MRAQCGSSAQMGKEHVDSCYAWTMPTMPDGDTQAFVLGVYAALRALLAGNSNRRLNC